jgi:hypothetical protein
MNGEPELYCKIFINCDLTKNELIQTIAKLVKGSVNGWDIQASNCEIYVSKNKDFDEFQRHDYPDGFLFYPFYLDVEAIEDKAIEKLDPSLYKNTIAKLLEDLWIRD